MHVACLQEGTYNDGVISNLQINLNRINIFEPSCSPSLMSARGGSSTAATSKMELFMIIYNGFQAVNYYHKELYLGCCSSPRSASRYIFLKFQRFCYISKIIIKNFRYFFLIFHFFLSYRPIVFTALLLFEKRGLTVEQNFLLSTVTFGFILLR